MGEKKVNGRKRHIAVDTQGNLLHSEVHAANVHDTDGLRDVVAELLLRYPTIKHLWLDAGYRGCERWLADRYGLTVTIVTKQPQQHTFVVLPRRWVVERTFAQLGRSRILSKAYTHREEYSVTWLRLAAMQRLLRCLAPDPSVPRPYACRKRDRTGRPRPVP